VTKLRTGTAVPAAVACLFAFLFLGIGNYLNTRQAESDDRITALRAEVASLRRQLPVVGASGTSAAIPAPVDDQSRAAFAADIKRQLQDEMGLLPLTLLRDRRGSFIELYSYDDRGGSSYGTAGYLGNGYFITVKHAVVALDQDGQSVGRRIVSIRLAHKGRRLPARVVDAGDAKTEVGPGDWAIVKVNEPVDLPALTVNTNYDFTFADPIFRLGNDYSQGISVSTGYIGQRTANHLVTSLTDGHPGVSGGGVLNQQGDLVGIPIGRMQSDYRFSFILPLRSEMFRKIVPLVAAVSALTTPIAP